MRKTNEQFLKDLELVNPNIKPLEIYVTNKTPILCKCLICEHEWKVNPSNLLSKKGCPNCKKMKLSQMHQYSTQDFINKAVIVHNNKYNYSKVNYINCYTPVKIICPEHGEFELLPAYHLSGRGCLLCANNIKKTTEQFIKEAKEVHGDRYDYSKTVYESAHKKLCIICKEHGEFLQTPVNHLLGKGCPKCKNSKGESFIEKYLKNNSIKYISLYEISIDKNINNSGKAFIDFYIPTKNLFIEYNGEQHYIAKSIFGGELRLNIQKQRDEYVRNYCKENLIKLIEIPYTLEWEEVTKLLNATLYE